MDNLPLVCDCGCDVTKHENSEIDKEIGEVAFDLKCARCGRYLGHFEWGHWEY